METEPDLKIGGLSIWIEGRQFPDLAGSLDGDYLLCTAVADAPGARVELRGSGLQSFYLQAFSEQLQSLYETLQGEASLRALDLGLGVDVSACSLGHMRVKVSMSADYGLTQDHTFQFELDQTDLRPMLSQVRAILRKYPAQYSAGMASR